MVCAQFPQMEEEELKGIALSQNVIRNKITSRCIVTGTYDLYFIYSAGRISDYTFACWQIAFCIIWQFSVNLQYKIVNSFSLSGDYYKMP